MGFIHPLQQSREWYKFVSEHAVKDPEVLQLAGAYIDAMNKLNRRLVELSQKQGVATVKLSNAPSASDGFIKMAKEYHEYHGVKLSEQELLDDARKHGLTPIHGI